MSATCREQVCSQALYGKEEFPSWEKGTHITVKDQQRGLRTGARVGKGGRHWAQGAPGTNPTGSWTRGSPGLGAPHEPQFQFPQEQEIKKLRRQTVEGGSVTAVLSSSKISGTFVAVLVFCCKTTRSQKLAVTQGTKSTCIHKTSIKQQFLKTDAGI